MPAAQRSGILLSRCCPAAPGRPPTHLVALRCCPLRRGMLPLPLLLVPLLLPLAAAVVAAEVAAPRRQLLAGHGFLQVSCHAVAAGGHNPPRRRQPLRQGDREQQAGGERQCSMHANQEGNPHTPPVRRRRYQPIRSCCRRRCCWSLPPLLPAPHLPPFPACGARPTARPARHSPPGSRQLHSSPLIPKEGRSGELASPPAQQAQRAAAGGRQAAGVGG